LEVLSGLKNIIYALFDIKEFHGDKKHAVLLSERGVRKCAWGCKYNLKIRSSKAAVKRSKTNLRKQTSISGASRTPAGQAGRG
jgi:hypothetical protein